MAETYSSNQYAGGSVKILYDQTYFISKLNFLLSNSDKFYARLLLYQMTVQYSIYKHSFLTH